MKLDVPDKKAPPHEELSEEDLKLKEELELMVEKMHDSALGIQRNALVAIAKEVKGSTSSMTSVPKPLKFLRPHWTRMKDFFAVVPSENKAILADILSVLSMTMGDDEKRDCLNFKLAGDMTEIDSWGHEYVRHLSGEISSEYTARLSAEAGVEDLQALVKIMIPYLMHHNAESEACDILVEVEMMDYLLQFVDEHNCERVANYLVQCARYMTMPEDAIVLRAVAEMYKKVDRQIDVARIAIKLADQDMLSAVVEVVKTDTQSLYQIGYILSRHGTFLNVDELGLDMEVAETLKGIIYNGSLSQNFLKLAEDLDIVTPKSPEDIYKNHLLASSSSATSGIGNHDSAKQNLASTYVNGFVNAGFGKDNLMTDEKQNWLHKNKDHGMIAAVASLGLIHLWNFEDAINELDRYLYTNDVNITAGALLGIGVCHASVHSEYDAALALLKEYVEKDEPMIRICALQGLGISYCCTAREDIFELLAPLLEDTGRGVETVATAGLALGSVFCGTAHPLVGEALLNALSDLTDAEAAVPHAKLLCLGLGLIYMGRREECEIALEILQATEMASLRNYAMITLESCAYFASGDVEKIQALLHVCGTHPEPDTPAPSNGSEDEQPPAKKSVLTATGGNPSDEPPSLDSGATPMDIEGDETNGQDSSSSTTTNNNTTNGTHGSGGDQKEKEKVKDESHMAVAVLGVALIAMGEEIGYEMSLRMFQHVFRYGELHVRRSVPLAIALMHVSNPVPEVMDALGKLTHDEDRETAWAAVLGMGLSAAGTNNSRVADSLRALAEFYSRDSQSLFVVRLAQGLVHAGKGTFTFNAAHSDRLLSRPASVVALMIMVHSSLNLPELLVSRHHYLLFYLSLAMIPRMLVTVDPELKPVKVNVRAGQAVDTVGQAGKPRRITGFQTHHTPILLSFSERAELADEEYKASNSTLEWVTIVTKNPDYIAEKDKRKM